MSRFQVTALLMVISLNSLSAIAQTPATLTSTYDNLLRDLETSSLYSNGLVLRSEKITRPIFTGFPNGGFKTTKGITIRGFAGDLKESRGQTFIAVGEDDHVYSSQPRVLNRCVPADTYHSNTTNTNKCYKVKEGDFIPGIHGYQLYSVGKSDIHLRIAHLYDNVRLSESLMDMYKVTSEEKYLNKAKSILRTLTQYHIQPDGTVRAHWSQFNKRAPYYRGMVQAIPMHAIRRFHSLSDSNDFLPSLNTLASTFVHSTEGVNNHFINSYMGIKITEERIAMPYIPERAKNELLELLDSIVRNDGRISYVMKGSAAYPSFKDSYQSYDFSILGRLIHFYADIPKKISIPAARRALKTTENINIGSKIDITDIQHAQRIVNGVKYFSQTYRSGLNVDLKKYIALNEALKQPDTINQIRTNNRTVDALRLISGLSTILKINNKNKIENINLQ